MKTFIDLFSGVGGFHLSFEEHANCVFASEWDDKARQTYLENFGEYLNQNNIDFGGDITQYDITNIPKHDILCAGFPCQPFSIAGKQLGFEHETQGTLFFRIIEIIQLHKPAVIFLENVKNLQSHDKGNTFKIIIKSLEDEGYTVKFKILNAKAHGNTPQNRERIFIVAFLDEKQSIRFSFPNEIKLTATLDDCLDLTKQPTKYYMTNLLSPSVVKIVEDVKNKNSIYQYRRYYVRENKNGVCPTLTANMGTGGHNVPFILDEYGVRKLTPRECFNFQSFPKDFKLPNLSDSHLYKQAGNSITVSVVKRIADNIIKSF